jgi:uncharacterized protein (UPF0332 family)
LTKPVTAVAYIQKAERALADARLLLRERATEGACNRAYYAMPDAAHAALWAAGVERVGTVIKRHGGLIAAFGQHLVQTGMIDPAHGRAFGRVEKMRLLADYTAGDPPADLDANEAVTLAEAFVAAIKEKFALQPPTPTP